MNLKVLLAVGIGGMLGAITRYSIAGMFPVYKDLPVGTLLVNSVASFLLGYLYGLIFFGYEVSSNWRAFFGTGFCGGLSTFSTFSYETFSLLREREHFLAFLNVSANVIITVGLVFLGFFLARR
ncbi:fluoride efflux transporter CrcB [Thermococcus sp. MV5]|uniref:fluoride efflux transporter CrcB n=1 Tax=Thermococcus sp. MV5 TaxID=1638272 RepID=UPI001438CE60|nr:fluoride efflux transporter CrcB [Thermococcus sp. MV5]NJE25305.1 fluoride efflux transporter CrcB [Thermococcus sp. MV5]